MHDSVEGVSSELRGTPHLHQLCVLMQRRECVGCLKGKMSRSPMTGVIDYRVDRKYSVLVADVIGPMRVPTIGGSKYVLNVLDVFSREIIESLMKQKSEATKLIITLILKQQALTGAKVLRLHTDGGKELVNNELKQFLDNNGTVHTVTTAHTPQHNALVERANRTLVESMKSMMYHADAHQKLWGEAVQTAAYVLNRSLTAAHPTHTPYEVNTGRKPNIANLHTFGCDAYYHVHKSQRNGKLDANARKGIFVGYSKVNDIYYRIFDVQLMKLVVSKDVRFFETSFNEMSKMKDAIKITDTTNTDDDDKTDEVLQRVNELFTSNNSIPSTQLSQNTTSTMTTTTTAATTHTTQNNDNSTVDNNNDNTSARTHPPTNIASQQESDDNDERIDVSSLREGDNDNDNDNAIQHDNNDDNSSNDGTIKRRSKRKRKEVFTLSEDDFAAAASTNTSLNKKVRIVEPDEPSSYEQAIKSSESVHWKAAIDREIKSLSKNNTWTVLKKNDTMNLVTTKWVFKKKRNEHGVVVRYKARLVARGFTQEYGIDYTETFAPVLKMKTLRMMIALSSTPNRQLVQLDVTTAFLNADVHEDIYITVPDGVTARTDEVLKLRKALYGLKQAPREWNSTISSHFTDNLQFERCKKDTCIYVKQSKTKHTIMIGLFVDDIVISYDKQDEVEVARMKIAMMKKFEMSDMGVMKHILGLRITYRDDCTYVDQQTYINDKITHFQQNNSTPTSTPGDANVALDDGAAAADTHEYRSLVGSLIYASTETRPDITHATNIISRYMTKPTINHLRAARKIFRYLNGCNNLALRFSNNDLTNSVNITAYCDADWGGDKSDRKSTTGYCVFVNDNLISWCTKKQQTVALSTAEAELMAMVEVAKEVEWLIQMLKEMKYNVNTPATIYSDNQSAVKIAHNDIDHDRTKHIDIKYYYIRELITNGSVAVTWVSTDRQTADIFTKPLAFPSFNRHRHVLLSLLHPSNKQQ